VFITTLLQISNDLVGTATESALQYGILGLATIMLAVVAWQQYRRLLDRNDALERKVDALQEEMNSLLIEERDRMSKLVEENTKALQELQKVIFNFMLNQK